MITLTCVLRIVYKEESVRVERPIKGIVVIWQYGLAIAGKSTKCGSVEGANSK